MAFHQLFAEGKYYKFIKESGGRVDEIKVLYMRSSRDVSNDRVLYTSDAFLNTSYNSKRA